MIKENKKPHQYKATECRNGSIRAWNGSINKLLIQKIKIHRSIMITTNITACENW